MVPTATNTMSECARTRSETSAPAAASSARRSASGTPRIETRVPWRTPSFSIRLFIDTSRVKGMRSELGGAEARLETSSGPVRIHRLGWLTEQGLADLGRLPHTVKILLENLLRRAGTRDVTDDDVLGLARWPAPGAEDLAFMPG